MEIPSTLPAQCLNPACGRRFQARNFIGGVTGAYWSFQGNTTSCPFCGKTAAYQDWHTDAQGKIHFAEFFSHLSLLADTEKIKKVRSALEAANDSGNTKSLANDLEQIDSSFSKFRGLLEQLSGQKATRLIASATRVATVLILLKECQISQRHLELAEQQAQQNVQHSQSQEQLSEEILRLQREHERLKFKFERFDQEARLEDGFRRNERCPCMSGDRYKHCCGAIRI